MWDKWQPIRIVAIGTQCHCRIIDIFDLENAGGTVGINPAHVKSVSQDGNTVLIRFSKAHSIGVEGELRAVTDQLNAAHR